MVPTPTLVALVAVALLTVVVPAGGLAFLATRRTPSGERRWPRLAIPFLCGALAFVLSQVLTRMPLMSIVVPALPEPFSRVLLSGPVASYSAGLFEETGRLVVMLLLMKAFHRWVDGVTFGLGHGGIEAVLLVGVTAVSNFILATAINTGGWAAIAASLPPEQAQAVQAALIETPASTFLLGGVERLSAITLHIACSLLILAGIVQGRKLIAWVVAVLVHGTFNLVAVGLLGAGVALLLVELVLLAIAAALWVGIMRSRRAFPQQDVAPKAQPTGPQFS